METKELLVLFENRLKLSLNNFHTNKKLKDAMSYSLNGGGKRIRPLLLLESYLLFSNNLNEVMDYAIALEFIHTYSLVHDDLPAMDDDDYRRGRPSIHKKFDEATAILTGDALLNTALNISIKKAKENPTKGLIANEILTDIAGVEGMLDGQMLDLFAEVKNLSDWEKLVSKKTGALIRGACEIGGVIGGANEDEQNLLKIFGENLGMAFQMQDDLLDEIQDRQEGNMTILKFMNKEDLKFEIIKKSNNAIKALSSINKDTRKLEFLTNSLIERKK